MGAIELKEYIKLQLENADERVLRIVASVFDNYSMKTEDNADEILTLLEKSELEYKKGKTNSFKNILEDSKQKYSQ